ncbi:MAG: T9SS type A sorting domain-containing protein [Bacteroidia bacterium]|jgi:hypothetical protein|nr:T9SS type A sorting domain-containing protein [Bacteroidia bacterium]
MMKKLLLIAALVTATAGFSQTKYVNDVHTRASVSRTNNIFYADGYSVLTGVPTLDSLYMDMYVSSENTDAAKPLIIYCHTGSFLPRYINQLATGGRDDSATVEMCMRFAQKGYVVASISYRTGWNPRATTETGRKSSIINAAYRGVQDLSAAVRYFKRDAAGSNTWKIDSTKICVGGQGTGGYLTSAYASLDNQEEIKIDKFFDFDNNEIMVNDSIWGDRMGLPIVPNTPYARSNWSGHTSNSQVAFNIGGAMGDTSWMDAGEIPLICVHGIYDPFAPYKTGVVKVPGTTLNVVEVSGGYSIMEKENALGNNAPYKGKVYDSYTFRANQLNDGLEGLFPIDGVANGSGPWEWWDSVRIRQVLTFSPRFSQEDITTINGNSSLSNPFMSKTRALAYIDTLQGYIAPRIAVSLGLTASVGLKTLDLSDDVSVYPVPASNNITVRNMNTVNTMQEVVLRDINGREVLRTPTSKSFLSIPLNIPAGVYFLNIQFDNGTATKKVIVD